MNAASIVQAAAIALALAWSACSAFRRLAPKTYRRLQARLLAELDRPASPQWLRGFARRAQPAASGGGSCGDGCSTCGGCAAASKPAADVQPLTFRPRLPK